MNHRFLLRLVTNLAVFLLTLSCFGIVLWVIDEFLMWDILPDVWGQIVRALLVAGGIIAFVLVVMNVLLSLALLAEANASRADLPNYGVSQRLKRRVRKSIIVSIVAAALLIGGLQITDQFRARAAAKEAQAEFIQAQVDMNESMAQVLDLFTPDLLDAIASNSLSEKGQLGNTSKLFNSIKSSFPDSPSVALIMPAAQPPFKYMRINSGSIRSNGNGKTVLAPEFYTNFPSETETQAIAQLFSGELPTLLEPLNGQILNNTLPSSWGVLKQNNKVVAVVYLASESTQNFNRIDSYRKSPDRYHSGPDDLLSN